MLGLLKTVLKSEVHGVFDVSDCDEYGFNYSLISSAMVFDNSTFVQNKAINFLDTKNQWTTGAGIIYVYDR